MLFDPRGDNLLLVPNHDHWPLSSVSPLWLLAPLWLHPTLKDKAALSLVEGGGVLTKFPEDVVYPINLIMQSTHTKWMLIHVILILRIEKNLSYHGVDFLWSCHSQLRNGLEGSLINVLTFFSMHILCSFLLSIPLFLFSAATVWAFLSSPPIDPQPVHHCAVCFLLYILCPSSHNWQVKNLLCDELSPQTVGRLIINNFINTCNMLTYITSS